MKTHQQNSSKLTSQHQHLHNQQQQGGKQPARYYVSSLVLPASCPCFVSLDHLYQVNIALYLLVYFLAKTVSIHVELVTKYLF